RQMLQEVAHDHEIEALVFQPAVQRRRAQQADAAFGTLSGEGVEVLAQLDGGEGRRREELAQLRGVQPRPAPKLEDGAACGERQGGEVPRLLGPTELDLLSEPRHLRGDAAGRLLGAIRRVHDATHRAVIGSPYFGQRVTSASGSTGWPGT